MKIHAMHRRLALLLVISLVATLALSAPAGAVVYQRDDNYNGVWQDWGGGWKYIYYSASDYAAWALNGKSRFAYEYTSQQWWDCDKFSSWRKIGATGVADWWIGDGAWHGLKNGWSYFYNSSGDSSAWMGNGLVRFSYEYGKGQWWDYGTAWNKIGATSVSSAFVGDGAWHNLGSGWSYAYTASVDYGSWADNGLARFLYEYGKGQWWDYGTAWNKIGATSVSSAFVGDGAWHNLKNGWSYFYNSSGDFSAWMDGGLVRFSYNYGTKQWSDFGTGWYTIGVTSASSAFIGDGAWHNLGNDWSYSYTASADLSVWADNGLARFLYEYGKGQWWDYGTAWNKIGATSVSSAFVGDGAYHALWGSGDTAKYKYLNGYGYWASSGTVDDNDFSYRYGNGQWYRYFDGSTAYDTVSYFGNRRYILTDYIYWTSGGLKSTTPTGSSYGTDVQYIVWDDPTSARLASWFIFTPGSDLKWSGGNLQVFVVDSEIQGGGVYWSGRTFLGWEQYSKEDVITLEYDFTNSGSRLNDILQGLGYVTAHYHKSIDDLAVLGHGNTTGFYLGYDWVSTGNYNSTYTSSWATLNSLMSDGGEIMLYHCMVGSAVTMLNSLAQMTNTKIFANINLGWYDYLAYVNPAYNMGDENVWNLNMGNFLIGSRACPQCRSQYPSMPDVAFIDQDFEYQSDTSLGKRGYHMLFDTYDSGWAQADMAWWWNEGNGRP